MTTSAAAGTLEFAPGETEQPITVLVNGDTVYEADETFAVVLDNPGGADVADASAQGTIQNDDAPPSLSIADASIAEGNAGTSELTFTVTKSGDTEVPASVGFETGDGTATAPADYQAAAGTLTFDPGDASQTITVLVNGDTTFEPDETLTVTLASPVDAAIVDDQATGTINNDDAGPAGTIRFLSAAVSAAEGSVNAVNITRTDGSQGAVQVTVTTDSSGSATGGDSCTAGIDFINLNTTASWADGETGIKQPPAHLPRRRMEPDETVTVVLSNPTGAPPWAHPAPASTPFSTTTQRAPARSGSSPLPCPPPRAA